MVKSVQVSGSKLATLRRERFYTQDELGAAIGMTGGGVRRIETAQSTGIQMKNFRRLAEVMKFSPDELQKRIGADQVETNGSPATKVLDQLVKDGKITREQVADYFGFRRQAASKRKK